MRNAAGGEWEEQISVAKTEQSGSKRERLPHHGVGCNPVPLLRGDGKSYCHRCVSQADDRGKMQGVGE